MCSTSSANSRICPRPSFNRIGIWSDVKLHLILFFPVCSPYVPPSAHQRILTCLLSAGFLIRRCCAACCCTVAYLLSKYLRGSPACDSRDHDGLRETSTGRPHSLPSAEARASGRFAPFRSRSTPRASPPSSRGVRLVFSSCPRPLTTMTGSTLTGHRLPGSARRAVLRHRAPRTEGCLAPPLKRPPPLNRTCLKIAEYRAYMLCQSQIQIKLKYCWMRLND